MGAASRTVGSGLWDPPHRAKYVLVCRLGSLDSIDPFWCSLYYTRGRLQQLFDSGNLIGAEPALECLRRALGVGGYLYGFLAIPGFNHRGVW